MRKIILVLTLAFVVLLAGCVQVPQKIGCCAKGNASNNEGCVLFNPDDGSLTDMRTKTTPELDGKKCDIGKGYCNVTLSTGLYLVPVCSEENLFKCKTGDCLAMVCGDFKFKPVITPTFGISDKDVKNKNEVSISVPAEEDSDAAINFYKAQCRFLTTDDKLSKIMKVSRSSLNTFRIGVGSSFDEFDQYKYYFPISDKFCGINLGGAVDRYMNYLNPTTLKPFDPLKGITTACFNDDAAPSSFSIQEKGITGPFTGYPVTGTFSQKQGYVQQSTSYEYNALVPELHNYKFEYWGTMNYPISLNEKGSYVLGTGIGSYDPYFEPTSLNKKIDDSFYKKWLSIADADTIYGLNPEKKSTTRAPFECDSSASECMSGVCSTSKYNRAVMLTEPDPMTGASQEVVTDCEEYRDEFSHRKIVCAPTTSVTIQGSNQAPKREYAAVDAAIIHRQTAQSYNSLGNVMNARATCGVWSYGAYQKQPSEVFMQMYGGGWDFAFEGGQEKVTCSLDKENGAFGYYTSDKKDVGKITNTATEGVIYTYKGTQDDIENWEPSFQEASKGPPAGGALFFGNLDPQPSYNGKTVIGYALASKDQVDDMLIVKNCQMKEGSDYEILEVSSNMKNSPGGKGVDWVTLAKVFQGYFKQRFSGLDQKVLGEGCAVSVCVDKCGEDKNVKYASTTYFYDFFFPSLPWVINMDKQRTEAPNAKMLLTSEIATSLSNTNRFSEPYISTSKPSTCDLGKMNYGWSAKIMDSGTNNYILTVGSELSYDFLYSKYIVLFYGGEGKTSLGKCALDPMGLPKTKTYGWCEACTASTLAFQKINATKAPYMPGGLSKISGGETNLDSLDNVLCKWSYNEIQCGNNYVSDMNDYSMKDGVLTAPKTQPDASVIKQRIGDYMKAGVMPILDLSDTSNWNSSGGYDFERLFGKMGATMIIVEHVNEGNAAAKSQSISERAAIIRSNCFGCLTSFQVDGAETYAKFQNAMNGVFSTTPTNRFAIDVVSFDYSTDGNKFNLPADIEINQIDDYKGQKTAEDIGKYAATALEKQKKPTMLVGLNVTGEGNLGSYEKLFNAILGKENEYIKSGLVGIIYYPVRQKNGLVVTGTYNSGEKTNMFCALEEAIEKKSNPAPIVIYSRINSVNATTCIPCSSLEKSIGACNADSLKCQNGIKCTPPNGMVEADIKGTYRCSDDTIIDNSNNRCTLCNEIPGNYDCKFSYANGTVVKVTGPMSDILSDTYQDIVAGLSKPNKCCLASSYGDRYSYVKKTLVSERDKPIAFSKDGIPGADCGLSSDAGAIQEAQSFCNVKIPLRDYDVKCEIK